MEHALNSVKVLDISEGISGPYCTKMMASFGAEVVKIEKPGDGDLSRKMGPFPNDEPHPERSAVFLYHNTGKKSITLNLGSRTGTKIVKELVKDTDVLVENFRPGVMTSLGLDYGILERINPGLVMTSITPFGQSGPYKDYKGSTIIEYALSGHMYINGEPSREPLQGPGPQPEYQGGLHGFMGTMMALYSREDTGKGQLVDVSMIEAMSGFHQFTLAMYSYGGEIKRRRGNRYESDHPITIYPCKDGYIAISASSRPQQELLYTLIGRPDLIEDPRFLTARGRLDHADEFDEIAIPWFMERAKNELFHTCSQWRIPCAPVADPEELVRDRHFQEREFWVEIGHPETGKLTYPGAPFKMSETPWQAQRAPLSGEHNEEIYCQRLGYTKEELVKLRQAGII